MASLLSLGSLINHHDDDDKENAKKQLVLWAKQRRLCTCITLFSTFLRSSLHDYDVKLPDATYHGGREHTRTNSRSFFSFWTWIQSFKKWIQEKSLTFNHLKRSKKTRWGLKGSKLNHYFLATSHFRRRRCCISSLYIHWTLTNFMS